MDSTAEGIDTVMTQHHQLPQAKLAAVSYAPLRLRILKNYNRALKKIWNVRDWTFRYVTGGTVTVLANTNDIALPAGWMNEGQQGGVWAQVDGRPLSWRRAGEVNNYINADGATPQAGLPVVYTVIGLHTLRVYPAPSVNTVLELYYQGNAPVLTDASAGPGYGGITQLPVDWRETVLYELAIAYEMRDKGDMGSYPAQMETYKDALFDMICSERQGKPEAADLPRYAGSADVGL